MPGKCQITKAIREGLDSLNITASDPEWTNAIATKLCQIGRNFGFKVGAKVDSENRDWPERLYDVLWLDYNNIGQVVAAPWLLSANGKVLTRSSMTSTSFFWRGRASV